MKKTYHLHNSKGGAAVTIICKRNKSKLGWGKINADGNILFYLPLDATEKSRDESVISAFSESLKISKKDIEVFSGAKDNLIVTIMNIDTADLDQLLVSLK